jgi:hypothetical protein
VLCKRELTKKECETKDYVRGKAARCKMEMLDEMECMTHGANRDMSLNVLLNRVPMCEWNQDPADWSDILRGVCASVDKKM